MALDTITFEEVEPGRTRVVTLTVVESFQIRDLILSSGMEVGVHDGYARLDAMLAGNLEGGLRRGRHGRGCVATEGDRLSSSPR